jgi:hypothetical protein
MSSFTSTNSRCAPFMNSTPILLMISAALAMSVALGLVSRSDRSTLLPVSAALHRSTKGLLFLFRRSVALPASSVCNAGKSAHYRFRS